jgi:PPOX class probable F420-dependent enzyme
VPKPPVPAEIDAFLAKPNPCIIATLRPDGSPVTVATWYDREDGRVLVNMDEGRRRLEHLRADPRVSLTIMATDNWNAFVSLQGRVVSLEQDTDLSDIDRLSTRYGEGPFSARDRGRVSAWIEIERWYAWHPENL